MLLGGASKHAFQCHHWWHQPKADRWQSGLLLGCICRHGVLVEVHLAVAKNRQQPPQCIKVGEGMEQERLSRGCTAQHLALHVPYI
eukprot:1159980-Pelagomonas_calceolata.AAC.3